MKGFGETERTGFLNQRQIKALDTREDAIDQVTTKLVFIVM